jgi:hypothetical protein
MLMMLWCAHGLFDQVYICGDIEEFVISELHRADKSFGFKFFGVVVD